MDLAILADHRVKLKKQEKLDNCLDFDRELKKEETIEHESYSDTNHSQSTWEHRKGSGK